MSDTSQAVETSNQAGTSQRPLSVTIIGWLFIIVGTVGLVYHGTEFKRDGPFQYEVVLVCLIRLLAIVCGVFVLRGSNWARWGLLVWIAYHVVLSAFHTLFELVVHGLLSVVVAWFLLRPSRRISGCENGSDSRDETTGSTMSCRHSLRKILRRYIQNRISQNTSNVAVRSNMGA